MAYKGKHILAVIPARGGSKGVPRKNLLNIDGMSLIARAASIVNDIDVIDLAVLSSDDEEIIVEGQTHGLFVPFVRPQELATDTANVVDVWKHAVLETENLTGQQFDCSVLLEPTSPLRKVNHVLEVIVKLIDGGFDSVISVSETDSKSHPLKQLVINKDRITFYDQLGRNITARQQLNTVYHRNGVAYAITKECLLEQEKIIVQNSSAVVIHDYVVNIDTRSDVNIMRWLCRQDDDTRE